tara:strand:- start:897 stop:1073 length:177 start_codon:yes stop_codon:yes gene_type:complete
MNDCPDKLEPLSESDMLLFIKLTLQDVICGALSMGDHLIDVNAVQQSLKYTQTLKEKL